MPPDHPQAHASKQTVPQVLRTTMGTVRVPRGGTI
jgi:hypothetical protein